MTIAPLPPGTTVSPDTPAGCRVVGVISQNEHGITYAAETLATGRACVLKEAARADLAVRPVSDSSLTPLPGSESRWMLWLRRFEHAPWAPIERAERGPADALGPHTDLYAWAMTVFGLTCGHPGTGGWPVSARARQLVADTGQGDPYADAAGTLRARGACAGWADAIAACLAHAPRERPASVAEVNARAARRIR